MHRSGEDADSGEACACRKDRKDMGKDMGNPCGRIWEMIWEILVEGYGKSLYFLLSFVVNPKML